VILPSACWQAGAANAADDSASAWTALRADGHDALIRHASAPGPVGDPADYKLDDCATQRNLSEQGRAEARAMGERFRTQRVKVGKVISSEWCRCRQTAELMNIGPVEVAPTFNNAFVLNATRDALTAGARATIGAWRGPGTLVSPTAKTLWQCLASTRGKGKSLWWRQTRPARIR
jgi:hypothetical protein